MAIIINSKFNPFSYAEMLLPIAVATLAHLALEDAYSDLDTKASVWEKLADSTLDQDVYQQYKSFADNLRQQADLLAMEGLTPVSRRNMLDMRSKYALEIIPIEQAWNERDRQIKLQQEVMSKDPTHMYRTKASEVGLGKFINNPGYDTLSDNYSGALLTQQASQVASNLKTVLTDLGKGKLLKLGLPFQYERELRYGYTPEQINAALRGDRNASPVLTHIINQVLQSSGISNWENYPQLRNKVLGFIGLGLYSAIGKSDNQTFKDDYSSRISLMNYKGKEKDKDDPSNNLNLSYNPIALRSLHEISEANLKVNKYKKYFYQKNGEWYINHEGWKEYNKPEGQTVTIGPAAGMQNKNQFREFVNQIMPGLNIRTRSGKEFDSSPITERQKKLIGSYFGEYLKSTNPENYDTWHSTGFDRHIDSEDLQDILDDMKKAVRKGSKTDPEDAGFQIVDFLGKEGFKEEGTLTLAEVIEKEYKPTHETVSKYGTVITLQSDKDGSIVSILDPVGRNTAALNARRNAAEKAELYSYIMNGKREPIIQQTLNDTFEFVLDDNGLPKLSDEPISTTTLSWLYRNLNASIWDIEKNSARLASQKKTPSEKIPSTDNIYLDD